MCQLQSLDVWCEHDGKAKPAQQTTISAPRPHTDAPVRAHGPQDALTPGGAGKRHAAREHDGKLLIDIMPGGPTLKQTFLFSSLEIGNTVYSDKLTFCAVVGSPDSRHPAWTISGPNLPTQPIYPGKQEIEWKFKTLGFKTGSLPFLDFYWRPEITPDEYIITCRACRGDAQEALVRVWPRFKSKLDIWTVDDEDGKERGKQLVHAVKHAKHEARQQCLEWTKHLSQARKAVTEVFRVLGKWIPNVDDVTCTLFEGSLSLSNEYEEEEEGAEVVWKGELELEMVVLSIDVKVAAAQANWLPHNVQEYFDKLGGSFQAEIYFEFKGEAKTSVKGVWIAEKQKQLKAEIGGSVALSVGAESHVKVGGNVLAADIHATTKLAIKSEPKVTRQPSITLEKNEFSWEPLVVAGEVRLQRKNVWLVGDLDKQIVGVDLKLFDTIKVPMQSRQLWPLES